jgi:hypothetical protein
MARWRRLPTKSTVGQASSMATTRPEGRWRLLTSHRGEVHRWGPRGGGGWAGQEEGRRRRSMVRPAVDATVVLWRHIAAVQLDAWTRALSGQ